MEAAVAASTARSTPESPSGVAALQPGKPLSGRFAVVRKDRQQSKAGTPYLALELRDRTGSIPARIFRDADQLGARFERGDAIEARGKVERFRGRLSAEVTALRRIEPGSFDPAEFLPSAYRSTEELEGFFEHLVGEIYDPGLRGVVAGGRRRRADRHRAAPGARAPAAATTPTSAACSSTPSPSGTLVGEVCQLHPKLNSDLLMAAALLHDIGKTREFTYGAEFGISDEGAMLGHLAIGAELIGGPARRLPDEMRLALLHCVLSHHGPEAAGRSRGAGSGFGNAGGAGAGPDQLARREREGRPGARSAVDVGTPVSDAAGEVLVFAVGVALSPSAVIASVLLLVGPRGRLGAAVFAVSWAVSLAVVGTGALLLADGAGATDDGGSAGWVGVVQVILASLLIVLAVSQWRGRLREGAASEMPRWMRKVDGLTTAEAAGMAAFLAAVKPKNLLLTIGAAVAIAEQGVSAGAQAGALIAFVLLGTLAPAAPLALSLLMREGSTAALQRVREWMVRENTTIIAVICLIFAAKLLGDALGA